MSQNYKKLKIKHDFPISFSEKLIENFDAQITKYTQKDVSDFDIKFYQTDKEIIDKLYSYVPDTYHKYFSHTCTMVVKTNVYNHIDNTNGCNLNFYVDTGKSITSFYKPDYQGEITRYGDRGVRFYNDLEFIESFVPKNGDVYILDVTVPHGIVLHEIGTRIIHTLHCVLPFSEACEMFKDLCDE